MLRVVDRAGPLLPLRPTRSPGTLVSAVVDKFEALSKNGVLRVVAANTGIRAAMFSVRNPISCGTQAHISVSVIFSVQHIQSIRRMQSNSICIDAHG